MHCKPIHTVQLNLNLTVHVCSSYMTQHVSENVRNFACVCMKDRWRINACQVYTCTHKMLFCCHVHHTMSCTKSLHAYLVCTNCTCAFWFAWARVFNWCAVWLGIYKSNTYICSKLNKIMCMRTYCYHHEEHIIYRFAEVILTVLTLSNKLTVCYRDIQMTTTCILTLWFAWSSAWRIWRGFFIKQYYFYCYYQVYGYT